MRPTEAALLFLLPAAVAGVAAAPVAGWFAARRGWLPVLRIGLALGTVVAIFAATMPPSPPTIVGVSVLAGIACNGIVLTTVNGLGVVQSPTRAPASLPALNGAAFGVGISAGIAVVAPLVARGTLDGFATAFFAEAALCVGALLASYLVRRGNSTVPPVDNTLPAGLPTVPMRREFDQ